VVRALDARFGAVTVVETACTGDAGRLAQQAAEDGTELIVALGGDGTISECVSGILSSTSPQTPLAFIPVGTGCDFAANFGARAGCDVWVERITWPETRQIDASEIRVNGAFGNAPPRYFNNIASFGVSGAIATRVNSARRLPMVPGKWLFFVHSLIALLRYRPVLLRMSIDGRDAGTFPVTLAVAANGPRFGGGMRIAPMAELDDGLMEIVIIPALPKWRIFLEFSRIYSGRHLENPMVIHVRARNFSVEQVGDGDATLLFGEIDGEPAAAKAFSLSIKPKSLSVAH
jgi:YegS/Rv2252/BmrU family lipid kinase